jgi:hypothetical protein
MATNKKKTETRGRKKNPLAVRVIFRVTEEEYAQIVADAEAGGRKVTDQVRWTYFKATKETHNGNATARPGNSAASR